MAPNTKTSSAADRRKSNGASKPGLVTLRVAPLELRKIVDPASIKEESPVKDSPDNSNPQPAETTPAPANGENASDSTPNTPGGSGTPSQVMGPPTEGPKKKGVKRGAAAANADPTAKVRGKPGPKKKARLDDGTDQNGPARGSTYHKLGPKANQGAINAGLRALDRSGKPCRKWGKSSFRLKSFTGVLWEISRWSAPPKTKPEETNGESGSAAESSGNSNKENKDASQTKSDNNSNSVAPEAAEPTSLAPSVSASSPAPVPVAAAS